MSMYKDGLYTYICEYEFKGVYPGKILTVEVDSLGRVMDGFWIDEHKEFTTGGDCKYWIPPSQIRIVTKV